MPNDPSLLAELGIRVPAAFAGLGGGIVGAWADSKAGWKTWLSYAVCGALTGNWLGEPATHIIPFVNEGGGGFIVGACAFAIIGTFLGLSKKWRPPIMNGGKPS